MRKIITISKFAVFGSILLTAAACVGPAGGDTSGETTAPTSEVDRGPADLHLWHNFGSQYSDSVAKSLIDPLFFNDGINVKAQSKGSYDKLKEAVSYSLSTRDFPNIATGYPDHFADYARSGYTDATPTGVLYNLNEFLDDEALNEAHKEKTGYTFREDFYEEYMVENDSIAYDKNDKSLTVGLPFNKSTEVLGYNGVFFDYVKSKVPTIKVPETWAEWKELGPVFRQYQMELNGKKLYGKQDVDGTAHDFSLTEGAGLKLLLDFSEANDDESAVLSWDSLANMFITLVRQFDSTFTSYTTQDRKATKVEDRHGYMEFFTGDNKAKTVEAMQLVRDLAGTTNETRIFATPTYFGGSYASDAFAQNKVLFTICSTGGLSYNINEGQRFRVAPVPYKDASHKYVISQGANMTVFDRNNIDNKDKYNWTQTVKLAFDTVIKMTTGEYQAKWATLTGYYPASRSATMSETYQSFINPTTPDYSDPIATAYREGAKLNQDEYMLASKNWKKFVDPGFVGSATIRLKAENIVSDVINSMGDKTIEQVLEGVYSDPQLTKYVRK